MTSSGASIDLNSSSMICLVRSGLKPPEPAPIRGNAMDWKPCSLAIFRALLTESRIERSEANCCDGAMILSVNTTNGHH